MKGTDKDDRCPKDGHHGPAVEQKCKGQRGPKDPPHQDPVVGRVQKEHKDHVRQLIVKKKELILEAKDHKEQQKPENKLEKNEMLY